MKKTHTILLIEDEEIQAKVMVEILTGFGFHVLHAASQEEAEPYIDSDEYCLVILDMEMKRWRASGDAHIAIGQALQKRIRERHPGLTSKGEYYLPILVMSGHDDFDFVVGTLKAKASDFLSKNLDPKGKKLSAAIEVALTNAEREDHVLCCTRATDRSRGGTAATAAVPRACIGLVGLERGRSTAITVDGDPHAIPTASFRVLAHLLSAAQRSREEYVEKSEFGSLEESPRQVSRLRDDFEKIAGERARAWVDGNQSGGYRLHPAVEIGDVDWARIAKHSDSRIRAIAAAAKR